MLVKLGEVKISKYGNDKMVTIPKKQVVIQFGDTFYTNLDSINVIYRDKELKTGLEKFRFKIEKVNTEDVEIYTLHAKTIMQLGKGCLNEKIVELL